MASRAADLQCRFGAAPPPHHHPLSLRRSRPPALCATSFTPAASAPGIFLGTCMGGWVGGWGGVGCGGGGCARWWGRYAPLLSVHGVGKQAQPRRQCVHALHIRRLQPAPPHQTPKRTLYSFLRNFDAAWSARWHSTRSSTSGSMAAGRPLVLLPRGEGLPRVDGRAEPDCVCADGVGRCGDGLHIGAWTGSRAVALCRAASSLMW